MANPLLGEYTGLYFQISAQHVEDGIPELVKQTKEKFTEFENNLGGKSLYSILISFNFFYICLTFSVRNPKLINY